MLFWVDQSQFDSFPGWRSPKCRKKGIWWKAPVVSGLRTLGMFKCENSRLWVMLSACVLCSFEITGSTRNWRVFQGFSLFAVTGSTGVGGFTMPCSCCDCYLQQSLSPYPSSPLTPDSEEGFIMNIREEGRSTRVRNRPKPQPAKKTRVNAQRYSTTVCR